MRSIVFRKDRGSTWVIAAGMAVVFGSGCASHIPDNDGSGSARDPLCAHGASQEDRVDAGNWLNTYATYDPTSGIATMHTTVSNSNSVRGFTGGVIVAFVDIDGFPLFATPLNQWGLDGCWLSCPRSRSIDWSATVPANLRASVAGMSILQKSIDTYRAVLGSMNFVEQVADACGDITFFTPLEEVEAACDATAQALALTDPVLETVVDALREETVDAMMIDITSRAQMFGACPSGGGPVSGSSGAASVCTDGQTVNCPDSSGNYRICQGGMWGPCLR